ncbi:RICIN domain-containing protein [Aliifodinibius sp. S!AR15-10]|uniref:RICIN domain-containing protein n=1 Tax=Aliifodinibius sp. S!AR15-10 TaxID=2950437 RepID=UPI00285FC8A8|nr:RICIN domain-containing protein [Aliifodinibius sp. S!AR15-10]MDR8393801.1 RICIN domain-containing protein [Aliifodinibius sp. S!AR15-10]
MGKIIRDVLLLITFSLLFFFGCETEKQKKEINEPPTPFIDRFMDVPVTNGLESNLWGRSYVLPRDAENGIESPDWAYWGGDVIKGPEGKYHMFVARWPEKQGHYPKEEERTSRIAWCTADNPEGPFTWQKDILGEIHGHNPAIIEHNGTYALYFISREGYDIALANSLEGPWTPMNLSIEGMEGWSNPAPVVRDDGSIVVVNRTPHNIYQADSLTGSYREVATNWVPEGFVDVEDQVVWREGGYYHLIANEWSRRAAFYMYSQDGINWILPSRYNAYVPGITHYENGASTLWYKIERPKVLVENGVATYIYFAVTDVAKDRNLGGDNHNDKTIAVPLSPLGSSKPRGPVSEGAYRIENSETNMVMSVIGGENEDGAPTHLRNWDNATNQRWLVTYIGNGAYRLEVTHSLEMDWQKVLSVENASMQDGASLVQQTWNDGDGEEQLWEIQENNDGTYRITNMHSGKVADITNDSIGVGPHVIQAEWDNSESQKWKFKMPISN